MLSYDTCNLHSRAHRQCHQGSIKEEMEIANVDCRNLHKIYCFFNSTKKNPRFY